MSQHMITRCLNYRLRGKPYSAGFSLVELMVVVVIVLVLAAISIPNLVKSKMMANEASVVGSLRTLTSACINYSTTWSKGFPVKLSNLGPGKPATSATADLIDGVLASGKKSGYKFVYVSGAPTNGTIPSYTITANPIAVNKTGTRYFFVDQSGVIRFHVGGPANATSKPLG
jgi:type IV pilus assembly protein PilA